MLFSSVFLSPFHFLPYIFIFSPATIFFRPPPAKKFRVYNPKIAFLRPFSLFYVQYSSFFHYPRLEFITEKTCKLSKGWGWCKGPSGHPSHAPGRHPLEEKCISAPGHTVESRHSMNLDYKPFK